MRTALKILAVDDEPSITESMRFIFASPQYQLTSAEDGDDALSRLAADPNTYDVVITDNNMPNTSGVELVQKLRERSFAGKIMVLSAHLSSELRAAYKKLAVDAMMDKPFDIYELRKTLDMVAA